MTYRSLSAAYRETILYHRYHLYVCIVPLLNCTQSFNRAPSLCCLLILQGHPALKTAGLPASCFSQSFSKGPAIYACLVFEAMTCCGFELHPPEALSRAAALTDLRKSRSLLFRSRVTAFQSYGCEIRTFFRCVQPNSSRLSFYILTLEG